MNELIRVLLDPSCIQQMKDAALDRILRQARTSFMMGVLERRLSAHDLVRRLPEIARNQLHSGRVLAEKIRRGMLMECDCLAEALKSFEGPVLILKGAAYLKLGLPPAEGRLFGDIDILIRRADLTDIEALLEESGWSTAGTDAYDEAYYRRWTHELPPMEHFDRGSIIDVHHAILQERNLNPTDRSSMITEARKLDGCFSTLQPADMVLHGAVHLFNDGEFDKGLRDLWDFVELMHHFEVHEPGFRDRLLERAVKLGFQQQLFYGLHYGEAILGLQNPEGYLDELRGQAGNSALMDKLLLRALMPDHQTAEDRWTKTARMALYYRGHYLRMPMRHLIPHLVRKAITPEKPAPGTQAG